MVEDALVYIAVFFFSLLFKMVRDIFSLCIFNRLRNRF